MEVTVNSLLPMATAFVLVVARLSGLFLLAPVFSSQLIPGRARLMALIVLAATLTPVVVPKTAVMPSNGVELAFMVAKESLIGLSLGFAVSIIFSAVQVGASLIDTTMGFSIANVIDPTSNSQVSIFGSFYSMVGTLAFLSVNGHYWLIAGFARSFDVVPVDQMPRFQKLLANTEEIFLQLFAMAFQIAAPVIITLLLVDIVLGIVSRVVPQMNVFFVGIPLKVAVGMVAIIVSLPGFIGFFSDRVSGIISSSSVLAGLG